MALNAPNFNSNITAVPLTGRKSKPYFPELLHWSCQKTMYAKEIRPWHIVYDPAPDTEYDSQTWRWDSGKQSPSFAQQQCLFEGIELKEAKRYNRFSLPAHRATAAIPRRMSQLDVSSIDTKNLTPDQVLSLVSLQQTTLQSQQQTIDQLQH